MKKRYNKKKSNIGFSNNEIYSSSRTTKHSKPKKKGRAIIIISAIVLALAIIASFIYGYLMDKLNKIDRGDINSSNVSVEGKIFGEGITNIALFGLDTFSESGTGRSDAIMVITIDKKKNKIKMTSIARDSYVYFDEEHGLDKITHAYVTKSTLPNKKTITGPEFAVRVLNQNFYLDITDYVTIKFHQLAEIIDELGGVSFDVNASEMTVMNREYISAFKEKGIKVNNITETGYQKLSGWQAVAYARDRYTGSDIDRTNRQKEIIVAVYEKVKKQGISKLNSIVNIAVDNCETSLSNSEILNYGSWALMSSPKIESYTLPDKDCNPKHGAEAYINDVWYYIYDLDIAKQKIHDFINEEGYFAPGTASDDSSTSN